MSSLYGRSLACFAFGAVGALISDEKAKDPARVVRAGLGGETYSPFLRGRDHSRV